MIKDLFEKQKEKIENGQLGQDGQPKPPVNIFSKPVNVSQSDEARKSRIKTVIIEALIFSAFLTAITVIYSLSGIDLKLHPTADQTPPSLFFYFTEFVVFFVLVGAGDYFMTEKRVNEYNQKVAGVAFNLEEEIEQALKEQEEDGISADQAAALNHADGEEDEPAPMKGFEIKTPDSVEYGSTALFEAFSEGEKAGTLTVCKGEVLDSIGIPQYILKIDAIDPVEDYSKKGVVKELFTAFKAYALENGYIAICASTELNNKYPISLYSISKYSLKTDLDLAVAEVYPGSLMGIDGEVMFK